MTSRPQTRLARSVRRRLDRDCGRCGRRRRLENETDPAPNPDTVLPGATASPRPRRGRRRQSAGRFEVFNSHTKWLQKERAAADVEGSRQADYLKDEVAARVCERLLVNTSLGPERKASRLWLRRF